MKIILSVLILLFSQTGFTANAWHWGKVTKIITYQSDGSFYVYIENENLKIGCIHKRVRYVATSIGLESTKAAMSLALSALHSGRDFGTVVDIPATSSEVCNAAGNGAQNSGIRI